jgi:hypothetical protein
MAAEKDPHTEERLELFRAYCEKKGWKDESGRWMVSEASAFFKREPNQVSNYLRGNTKTFGPRVASAMATSAGLPADTFEPNNSKNNLSPVAYELGRTFDQFKFTGDVQTAAFNAAVAAMAAFLGR